MALEGQAFLEQLHLDGCRRITDDGLAHIAGGLTADFLSCNLRQPEHQEEVRTGTLDLYLVACSSMVDTRS